jgi:predicted RNA-binding Zn-ribbon protein involved in translation (DUF1610 family)
MEMKGLKMGFVFVSKRKCPKCGKLSKFIGYDCDRKPMYACPKCGIWNP